MLYTSWISLVCSFDLDLQGDEIGPTEDSSTKGQSLEKVATSSEEHHVTQPQPAVIATRINEREVVRTTDIRVSERTPLADLRLKSFEPIYNELTGEVRYVHMYMYVYNVLIKYYYWGISPNVYLYY